MKKKQLQKKLIFHILIIIVFLASSFLNLSDISNPPQTCMAEVEMANPSMCASVEVYMFVWPDTLTFNLCNRVSKEI